MAVIVETKQRWISIILDRPPLNVLDVALLRELAGALAECAAAPADVVILRGAGQRAFSAGVDMRQDVNRHVVLHHSRENLAQLFL